MESNLPVWSYYPKDDSYFVDPMYFPYMKVSVPTKDGVCEVNTWAKQGYSDGFVNPALVRRGWGMDFQLLHPDKDPCPEGWTKGEDGWCAANEPEFGDHGLYSEDAFVPKYQYWDGYAPRLQNPHYMEINEFMQRSVSPWTGDYVVYSNPKLSTNRGTYGHLPSKDMMLA
jgi:hypothetical protein